MIAFYLHHLRSARNWARRHPRVTAVLVVITAIMLIDFVGTSSALADSTSGAQGVPYLPPVDITDTHGVSLVHYAVLPLDRGDAWTWQKSVPTTMVDGIWTVGLASIAWMLWMFQFQLSFQWVDWIATPLTAIGQVIHNTISATGWPGLALAITAVVAGTAIMLGRVAKGLIEICISVLCAALAVGILVNPIGSLTGPNGALTWVEANGGQLAASIASDSPTVPTGDATVGDASKVLSSTLTAQLVDLFVRQPAQEIAFGHNLTGACDDTFTAQMKNASPIDTSSTTVRDAVHGCDATAWDYVTHPGAGMVYTAWVTATGSGALLLLAFALGIVLLMCVLYALWCALKLVGLVYAAMLPGVARQGLFKSLIGMYVAVLTVGLIVVVMAGYLRLLTAMMSAVSKAGLDVFAQTQVVDVFIFALSIALFLIHRSAKRAGETLATRLSKIGFAGLGRGPEHRPNPVLQSAKRIGETYLANKMRPAAVGNTTINMLGLTGTGSSGAGSVDVGPVTATPAGGGAGGGGGAGHVAGAVRTASAARGAIAAGTSIGAAAATGGTSAVVMALGKVAGKQVIQRAVATGAQHALEAGESPSPNSDARYTGFGRQIVVGNDGIGTVSPREAPQQRDGSYRVTRIAKRTDIDPELRRRLAAAAKPKELSA